jgi:hypothetical protein
MGECLFRFKVRKKKDKIRNFNHEEHEGREGWRVNRSENPMDHRFNSLIQNPSQTSENHPTFLTLPNPPSKSSLRALRALRVLRGKTPNLLFSRFVPSWLSP